jgi:putative PIN family toxin of toxin-antitoxin system
MRNVPNKKVIIDTNCWISFLIGKRLSVLIDLFVNGNIKLIICNDLIKEIIDVTARPKFSKYFMKDDVFRLIKFIYSKSEMYEIEYKTHLCCDAADDFLLDLAKISEADYLLTGDEDLLIMKSIGNCKILDIKSFESIYK